MKDITCDQDHEREQDRSREHSRTHEAIEAQRQDENTPLETWLQGVINTITGGFTEERSSNSAHKHYAHNLNFVNSVAAKKMVTRSLPPIAFIGEDFEGQSNVTMIPWWQLRQRLLTSQYANFYLIMGARSMSYTSRPLNNQHTRQPY